MSVTLFSISYFLFLIAFRVSSVTFLFLIFQFLIEICIFMTLWGSGRATLRKIASTSSAIWGKLQPTVSQRMSPLGVAHWKFETGSKNIMPTPENSFAPQMILLGLRPGGWANYQLKCEVSFSEALSICPISQIFSNQAKSWKIRSRLMAGIIFHTFLARVLWVLRVTGSV